MQCCFREEIGHKSYPCQFSSSKGSRYKSLDDTNHQEELAGTWEGAPKLPCPQLHLMSTMIWLTHRWSRAGILLRLMTRYILNTLHGFLIFNQKSSQTQTFFYLATCEFVGLFLLSGHSAKLISLGKIQRLTKFSLWTLPGNDDE